MLLLWALGEAEPGRRARRARLLPAGGAYLRPRLLAGGEAEPRGVRSQEEPGTEAQTEGSSRQEEPIGRFMQQAICQAFA